MVFEMALQEQLAEIGYDLERDGDGYRIMSIDGRYAVNVAKAESDSLTFSEAKRIADGLYLRETGRAWGN